MTTPRIWKGNADRPEVPRGLLNPAQSHAAFLVAGLRPRETGGMGDDAQAPALVPRRPFPPPTPRAVLLPPHVGAALVNVPLERINGN